MVRENLKIFFVLIYFYPTFALAKTKEDSVAQLVEHIPFKDGVLGSRPSWITINSRDTPWRVPAIYILLNQFIG